MLSYLKWQQDFMCGSIKTTILVFIVSYRKRQQDFTSGSIKTSILEFVEPYFDMTIIYSLDSLTLSNEK